MPEKAVPGEPPLKEGTLCVVHRGLQCGEESQSRWWRLLSPCPWPCGGQLALLEGAQDGGLVAQPGGCLHLTGLLQEPQGKIKEERVVGRACSATLKFMYSRNSSSMLEKGPHL